MKQSHRNIKRASGPYSKFAAKRNRGQTFKHVELPQTQEPDQ